MSMRIRISSGTAMDGCVSFNCIATCTTITRTILIASVSWAEHRRRLRKILNIKGLVSRLLWYERRRGQSRHGHGSSFRNPTHRWKIFRYCYTQQHHNCNVTTQNIARTASSKCHRQVYLNQIKLVIVIYVKQWTTHCPTNEFHCFNRFHRQPWTSVSNGTADRWEVSLRLGRAGWDAEDASDVHCIILNIKVMGIKKYSWLQLIFTSAVWQWIIFARTRPNPTQPNPWVNPTHGHVWSQ